MEVAKMILQVKRKEILLFPLLSPKSSSFLLVVVPPLVFCPFQYPPPELQIWHYLTLQQWEDLFQRGTLGTAASHFQELYTLGAMWIL